MTDQIAFTDALLDPNLATPAGLSDPQGRPAGKRFDVYRNNVITSLTEAMILAFPVIHKLVGDEFFKAMCGVYVRANPPSDPLLMFYGKDFPQFLETFPPVSHLPYLSDVAKLELMRRTTYHATDSVSLPPEAVGEALSADPMEQKFTFAPATQLIQSSYPIMSLWTVNMEPDGRAIPSHGECVLVFRPEWDVEMTTITNDDFAFLTALMDGQTLEHALEAASDDFDLTPTLQMMLSTHIITKIGK